MNDNSPLKARLPFPDRTRHFVTGLLLLILLLGAFLRFYHLGAYSIGNTYYAAAVKSMLQSWHNFFFVAFEPGGSVSVDKPPLGFWVQALSAYFLGVNGFALAFPNALAGVLSIAVLYALVRKQFSDWAGLVAALALAVTPVVVSTERNNTIDGLLVFVLLLAGWAVWHSVETRKFRHLLLGMFLVGLGFNIKMLQAYMILPALYAVYFFGAEHGWWKRIAHLGIATVLLLVVSLSWTIIVDLTPASERPYVGSSEDNTEMELIVGHNGLSRLFARGRGPLRGPVGVAADGQGLPPGPNNGQAGPAGQYPARPPLPPAGIQPGQYTDRPPLPPAGSQPGQFQPAAGQPGQVYAGRPPMPPAGGGPGQFQPGAGQTGQFPGGQLPGNPGGGQRNIGPGRASEVGTAGVARLFSEPLNIEASWLLPLALMGIVLVLAVLGWTWPLNDKHLAVLLWAGWLLPVAIYFTFTTGLFHSYYLIMMGAPIAALTGASFWALGRLLQNRRWLGWALATLLTGVTVAFELFTLRNYPQYSGPVTAFSLTFWLIGLGLLAWRPRTWPGKVALGLVLLSLIIAPLTWSGLTAFNTSPNVSLPKAGPTTVGQGQDWSTTILTPVQQKILDYVEANTASGSYLLAAPNAREAAPYILATGRPVLAFGGFMGSDKIIDTDGLAQMIADGELRFVLDSGELSILKPEIAAWVKSNCSVIRLPGLDTTRTPNNPGVGAGISPPGVPGSPQQGMTLYDCGG